MNMCPKISYHKVFYHDYSIDIFNNKHIMIFDNIINWYMYKYLEMNNVQAYIYLLLITINVPLQIGNVPLGVHVPQVRNLWSKIYDYVVETPSAYWHARVNTSCFVKSQKSSEILPKQNGCYGAYGLLVWYSNFFMIKRTCMLCSSEHNSSKSHIT